MKPVAKHKQKIKLRKGDTVIVITGKDKGRKGDILKIMPAENRALVQGINKVKRHQRQSASEQGGIVEKEAPVHISNLAIADPKDGAPSKIGFKILNDGRKVRFAKRSGEEIDG